MRIIEYGYSPMVLATPSVSPAERKIRDFAKLPSGWHFGAGAPPESAIIDAASALVRDLVVLGFTKNDAFPGIEGEIGVSAYSGDETLEIIVEIDGSYTFARDDGTEETDRKERIDARALKRVLIDASKELWNSSAFYTPPSTTKRANDFRVSPSATLRTEAVFRSFQLVA